MIINKKKAVLDQFEEKVLFQSASPFFANMTLIDVIWVVVNL